MDPEDLRAAHLWGKHVCDAHVEDEWLASWVRSHAEATTCDYCERKESEPFAANVGELAEVVLAGLETAYGNADDEGVPWEGGYVLVQPMLSAELLDEEGPFNHPELINDIAGAMPHDAWVQRDFIRLSPFQRLRYGWDSFVELVKHHSRYFFGFRTTDEDDPDDIPPVDLLEHIGEALEAIGALRTLPTGTELFRARTHRTTVHLSRAKELDTAPVEYATSANRMSAAGVPMFYGALDGNTARDEAVSADPEKRPSVTVGTFETLRPLRVIDFTRPGDVPSLYDPEYGHRRGELGFLRSFVSEVSVPVTRGRTEHIEYVPTQVVTEYFRSVFTPGDGETIDGLMYPSVQRPGGVNVVLFLLNEEAIDADARRDEDAGLISSRRATLELIDVVETRIQTYDLTPRRLIRHALLRDAARVPTTAPRSASAGWRDARVPTAGLPSATS
jgi:hypothetical protein